MAIKTRADLKSYFQTGDIPTETQYSDLIDSFIHAGEATTQVITGDMSASSFIAENHVTASGNISASLTGSFGAIQVDSFSDINLQGDLTASGDVSVTGNITVAQITASSNISSSSTIHGNKVKIGSLGEIYENNGVYRFGQTVESIYVNNITASGEISASGTSHLGAIRIDGQSFASRNASTGDLTIGGANQNIYLQGVITASGHISASGTITANELTGTLTGTSTGLAGTPSISVTNITASSDISSSGTITMTTGSFKHIKGHDDVITIQNHTTFENTITASSHISASGDIVTNQTVSGSTVIATRVYATDTYRTNVSTHGGGFVQGGTVAGLENKNTQFTKINIPSLLPGNRSEIYTVTNNTVDDDSIVHCSTPSDVTVMVTSVGSSLPAGGGYKFYFYNPSMVSSSTAITVGSLNCTVL